MKPMDLFCASPASTAIRSSMNHLTTARPTTKFGDLSEHRLGETPRARPHTCSPKLPFFLNTRKSTSSNQIDSPRRKSSADVNNLIYSGEFSGQVEIKAGKYKRLSTDGLSEFRSLSIRDGARNLSQDVKKELRVPRPPPPMSIRSANESPIFKPSPAEGDQALLRKLSEKLSDHLNDQKSSSIVSSNRQVQVVELRVSIHCKACEGKLKKHISKMQGVTSFSVDFATKKVTVIGDVNPCSVLSSISKVKNAQFWPSTNTNTSCSSLSSPALKRHY